MGKISATGEICGQEFRGGDGGSLSVKRVVDTHREHRPQLF
jgi:hypothetical protein